MEQNVIISHQHSRCAQFFEVLGEGIEISNTDLDDVKNPGVYRTTVSVSNRPGNLNGVCAINTLRNIPRSMILRATGHSSEKAFVRYICYDEDN